MAGIEVRIDEAERESARLTLAEECLASSDLYTREAGAQTLAGLSAPDALCLREKACSASRNTVWQSLEILLDDLSPSGFRSGGSPMSEGR